MNSAQAAVSTSNDTFWLRLAGKLRVMQRSKPVARVEGSRLLVLTGSLDARLGREVKAWAAGLKGEEGQTWAIDLAGVTAWDANGLAALVHALDVAEQSQSALRLLKPSTRLRLTLERAQLHHLFAIADGDIAA